MSKETKNQTPAKETAPAAKPATPAASAPTVKPIIAAAVADAPTVTETKPKPAPRAGIDNLSILDAVKTLSAAAPKTDAAKPETAREPAFVKYEKDAEKTRETLFAALHTDAGTFDKLVKIAETIAKETAAIESAVKPLDGESAEPFHGTPAVVLYNVLHSVGHFAHRLDDFRDKLRQIDRANATHYASKFEREFAVYLALRMNVNRDFLASLRENDLSITRF